MNSREVSAHCQSSLKLLGDFWTLKIIDVLSEKDARFCELQRKLGGLNPVTLTDRLKKLEDANLVDRTEDKKDKVSVTYSLTTVGRKAIPIIESMNNIYQ